MTQPSSKPTGQPEVQPASNDSPREMPEWDVVLHRDEDNTIGDTIIALVEVTPLNLKDSAERTMQAHRDGRATLVTTHLERGELYRQQLSSRNLNVTLERSE